MKILINVKEIYVISFLEKNKLMASLPNPNPYFNDTHQDDFNDR